MRKGRAALEAVRLASAFFGKGQFVADELVVEKGSYVLRQKLEGIYFQPLTPEQMAANGGKVLDGAEWHAGDDPAAKRRLSEIQSLETVVTVAESQGRFELRLRSPERKNVPVSIELAFRAGGTLPE